ncbi:docking protein 2-like [Gymnodraco acuticeps]|uniref:Docking protein 2-like n=1 Tax=Gymnodraco acuticeps TaxID=8218 RepID=A0A6P8TE31_GYMAC|nr:docking protein 2-like [Gymnodraco acuticeps]
MEEDIRKQGMLFLQQQRFGKKWKRMWCVLFRESSCSISRLEFFECKDGGSVEKSDKTLRKQQEHKKMIRMSDCIRVSEVEVDGCPRDTGPFLIETTEKIYVFASERLQLEDWTHKLCEIAFPMSWPEGVKRGSLQRGSRVEEEVMEDNSLYSGRHTVRDFRVCVRRTEASDRCRLRGDRFLRADEDALLLLDKSGAPLYSWPYRYLRRFGRDKSSFSFEAGRRCDSGEGNFEFDTREGNFLFQAVEAAINLQRMPHPQRQSSGGGGSPETPRDLNPPLVRTPPLRQGRKHIPQCPAAQEDGVYSLVNEAPPLQAFHLKDKESLTAAQQPAQLCRLEPPVDKTLTAVKSLSLDPRGPPGPRKNLKMISSCPLPDAAPPPDQTYSQVALPADHGPRSAPPKDPEYSLPFDSLAPPPLSSPVIGPPPEHDPLYDSIDEMKIRNVFLSAAAIDHIYDEPEGRAPPLQKPTPLSLYDEPEEVRGDAWRVMGTPADPKGHEFPYNPRVDDYAVPKRPQRALPVGTNEEEEEEKENWKGEEPREEAEGEEGQHVEEEEEPNNEEEEEPYSPYNNVMMKQL